jgi:hypothetical protein
VDVRGIAETQEVIKDAGKQRLNHSPSGKWMNIKLFFDRRVGQPTLRSLIKFLLMPYRTVGMPLATDWQVCSYGTQSFVNQQKEEDD